MLVSIGRRYPHLDGRACILPVGFYSQSFFGGSVEGSLVFDESDVRDRVCFDPTRGTDDVELVCSPVARVDAGYITSSALLLDSLAPLILRWLHENGHWRVVVSDPFEDRVVDLFRQAGLASGTVSEAGWWRLSPNDQEQGDLQQRIRACGPTPGEIDALVLVGHVLVVIECKSVYSLGRPRNVAGKLSDEDIEGWRSTVRKKVSWLTEATGYEVQGTIVVEGVEIYDSSESDISIMDVADLWRLVTEEDD